MRLTIESTAAIVTLAGVRCRLWRGVTGGGVACDVYVHRCDVPPGADAAEFDRELREASPPPVNLVALVRELREAQRAYFRTRSAADLRLAREVEQRVDDLLSTPPTPGLFDHP